MIRPPDDFVSACKNIHLSASEKIACKQNMMKRVTGTKAARHTVSSMDLNAFHQSAKAISLAPHEKMQLKEVLRASMKHAPTTPVFFARFRWINPFKTFTSAMAAVLIVVMSGAGVSYAAEDAIPGDLLYPIKVSINEELRVKLARDPMTRARLEQHFAERRMREAETLALQNRLDAAAEEDISARFKAHAQAIRDETAGMDEKSRLALRHQMTSSLETSVKAHIAILHSLQNAEAADAPATDPAAAANKMMVFRIALPTETGLEAALHEEALRSETERVTLEFAMGEGDVFEGNLREAIASLSTIEGQLQSQKDTLPAATQKFVKRRVDMAKLGLQEAQAAAANQGEKRNQTTRTTLRALKEAEISLSVQAKIFRQQEKEALTAEEQMQVEQHEDNTALANAKISVIRGKINKIHKAVGSTTNGEGAANDPALIPVEARITGAEQLIDIANEQIGAGNADAALDAVESARKHTDLADDEATTVLQNSASASAPAVEIPVTNQPTPPVAPTVVPGI